MRTPTTPKQAVAQPIVIEQRVAGGEPQTVSVPAYTYDDSHPSTRSRPRPPTRSLAPPSRSSTRRGCFWHRRLCRGTRLTDEALKVLPNHATLHEFRALVLFAVGKYDLAAGPLYAVLSVGPGWDWTTMAGLYPDIEVYTTQLRKLEAYVTANPTSTAGRFVLAYHYLTQGNTDAAVGSAQGGRRPGSPGHTLRPALKQFSPPATAPGHPGGSDRSATLDDTRQAGESGRKLDRTPGQRYDDRPANWGRRDVHLEVTAKGKPRQLAGKWSLTNNLLTLAQEGDAGGLVGRVSWQADDKWSFRVIGTGAEDQGLLFTH